MQLITMIIEDGKQPEVSATASSNKGGNIYIVASNVEEAQELIKEGTAKLAEAMGSWKPETDPKEDRRTKAEIMKTNAEAYEVSIQGKHFIKNLGKAKNFWLSHHGRIIGTDALVYLSNKHSNNFLDGSFDLIALAFTKGYSLGKSEAKSK